MAYCISLGLLEKQEQEDTHTRVCVRLYDKILVYMVVEAENSQELRSTR